MNQLGVLYPVLHYELASWKMVTAHRVVNVLTAVAKGGSE